MLAVVLLLLQRGFSWDEAARQLGLRLSGWFMSCLQPSAIGLSECGALCWYCDGLALPDTCGNAYGKFGYRFLGALGRCEPGESNWIPQSVGPARGCWLWVSHLMLTDC